MTIPTLTTLPVAPARTDPPATFVTRADAFLGAIVTFQGEMNTSIGQMNIDIPLAIAASETAVAAAASAVAVAGATEWVSGTTYAEGDAVWSPVTYQTYRRKTDGAGATDPSADTTNWEKISGVLPIQTGNAGNFLQTDGTVASWAAVAAAGEISATANENITAGQPVTLRSDGKVEPVAGTQTSGFRTPYVSVAGRSDMLRTAFDSTNNKLIVAHSDPFSNALKVKIGVVSDANITFGSDATITSSWSSVFDIGYDPVAERVVVVYKNPANNYSYIVIGQIIASSVSFGTPVQYQTTNTEDISICYDIANNKWNIASAQGTVTHTAIATIDNLTATVTTPASTGYYGNYVSVLYDSVNSLTVIASAYSSSGVIVAAFSSDGTTLTKIGTQITVSVFGFGQYRASIAYHSEQNVYVVGCRDTSNKMYAFAFSLTGTTYTAGTVIQLNGDLVNDIGIYDSQYAFYMNSINKMYIRTNTQYSGRQKYNEITVSGTTLSLSGSSRTIDPKYFGSSVRDSFVSSAIFCSSINGIAVVSANSGASNDPDLTFATIVSVGSETTNATDFVGIAAENITSGLSGKINIISGTNTSVFGLTAGTEYWLNYDGSLSIIETSYSKVGVATSATSILLTANSLSPTLNSVSGRIPYEVNSEVTAGDLLFLDTDGLPARIQVIPTLPTFSEYVMNNYDLSPQGSFTPGYLGTLPTPDGGGILMLLTTSNYMVFKPFNYVDGVLTFGSNYNFNHGYAISNSTTYGFDSAWDAVNQVWVVALQDGSYNSFIACLNKNGLSLTVGSDYLGTIGGNNYGMLVEIFQETGDYAICWQNANASSYASLRFRRYNGTNTTAISTLGGSLPAQLENGLGYNPVDNKLYHFFKYSSAYYYNVYEYNGSTYTRTVTNSTITVPTYSNSYSLTACPLIYDANSGHMLMHTHNASGSYQIHALSISSGGNTLTKVGNSYTSSYLSYLSSGRPKWMSSGAAAVISTGGFISYFIFDGADISYLGATGYIYGYPWTSAYNSTSGVIMKSYRTSATSYNTETYISSTSNSSSFFAIAASASSLGLTAQVDLIGGINSYQNQLNSGSTYYVNGSGSLTTTATEYRVGKALNGSTLYITG